MLAAISGAPSSHAQTSGDLRLAEGTVPSEGRVEMYYDGSWGTVCDDYWVGRNSTVVCRQLGYDGAASYPLDRAHFGPGTGPIWLDDVVCSGDEATLLDCPRRNLGEVGRHNCSHAEDIGVTCSTTRTPRISIRTRTVHVGEGDASGATYEVVLANAPSANVTVSVAVPDDSELTVVPGALTFTTDNWSAPRRVTVRAGTDTDTLDDTVVLRHTATGGGYDSAAPFDVTVHVRDDDIEALSASFHGLPDAHNGWTPFSLELQFSQAIRGSAEGLRQALQVSGGELTDVQGIAGSENSHWTLTVEPQTWGTLTITIPVAPDCSGSGAVCTRNRDPLSAPVRQSISGPPYSTEPRYRPGDIRLAGASVPWEGRVEMFYASEEASGAWGTVCSRSWNLRDAHVACRGAGYDGASGIHTDAHFGQGTGTVWLAGLDCSGSEENLLDCRRLYPVGSTACRHSQDAGVTCDTTGTNRILVTPTVLELDEEDPSGAAYDVALLARPSADVTVNISGTTGTDLTVLPTSLTFSPDDWDDPRSVTVTAAADADAAPDIVPLTHRASGDYRDMVAAVATVTIRDNDDPPGTARFLGVPTTHDGRRPFTFELRFDRDFPVSYRTIRDVSLQATGGRVKRARRIERPRNRRWRIMIEPRTQGDITVVLRDDAACGEPAALCTEGGTNLATRLVARISGPSSRRVIAVADSRASEAAGATVDFTVTIAPPPVSAASVEWLTVDGTATAGEDYTAAVGRLDFAPGESAKTVSVALLDDIVNEDEETFFLRLTTPRGVEFGDDEAVGTIANDDPMPGAWLARFGRTLASQAVDVISDRLSSARESRVVVGGVLAETFDRPPVSAPGLRDSLPLDHFDGPEARSGVRAVEGRDFLVGSAFRTGIGGDDGSPAWGAWGRFAGAGFESDADGVRMDGEVTTAFLGADVAQGSWIGGVAVSISEGEGDFLPDEVVGGRIHASLASLYPYVQVGVADRVDVWTLLGFGTGDLKVRPRFTDVPIRMRMGAIGARGALLAPDRSAGLSLSLESDAFWVRMESDPVHTSRGNLAGSDADAARIRLALEGSRSFELGDGRLIPSAQAAIRHDAGDAEAGTGLQVGGKLRYVRSGVTVEGAVHTLVAHQDSGFEEWGVSGALRVDPETSGRGLSLVLTPTWGPASGGGDRVWSAVRHPALVPDADLRSAPQLDADLGYGIRFPTGLGVLTPFAGLSLRDGGDRTLRTGARWSRGPEASFVLQIERSPRADDVRTHEDNALMLRGVLRW